MLEPWEKVSVSDGEKAAYEEAMECVHAGGVYNEYTRKCIRKGDVQAHYDGKEYGVYSRQAANPVPTSSPLARQVGGSHYKDAGIQPVEYIRANNLNFFEGNAVKYITRHRVKGGKADLEKAIHYLEMEIADSYGS